MIWAWKDPDPTRRASFFIPFEWLQEAWKEVHGAFHVNLKRIGARATDARRLSRYMVAQYCGGQHALVRVSQSRSEFPLTAMRQQLFQLLRELPERYEFGEKLRASLGGAMFVPGTVQWIEGRKVRVPLPPDAPTYEPSDFTKAFNSFFWTAFRQAWDSLVSARSCEAYGVQFVAIGGAVVRL
jgi:hypothetical protein